LDKKSLILLKGIKEERKIMRWTNSRDFDRAECIPEVSVSLRGRRTPQPVVVFDKDSLHID
jgi:hypothetical protein